MKYQPRLEIVLFQPEIPYNAGSVGRTCVAIEAKLWMVRPLGFRTDDYYLRRAGLDYWQHLEWEVVTDWSALTDQLGDRRMWFFSKKASRLYSEIRYDEGDLLVFGSESQGLPGGMLDEAGDRSLRIPVSGKVRSLNLSCAVSVAAYEALRQWEWPGERPEG